MRKLRRDSTGSGGADSHDPINPQKRKCLHQEGTLPLQRSVHPFRPWTRPEKGKRSRVLQGGIFSVLHFILVSVGWGETKKLTGPRSLERVLDEHTNQIHFVLHQFFGRRYRGKDRFDEFDSPRGR